jgi:hypothetical protein
MPEYHDFPRIRSYHLAFIAGLITLVSNSVFWAIVVIQSQFCARSDLFPMSLTQFSGVVLNLNLVLTAFCFVACAAFSLRAIIRFFLGRDGRRAIAFVTIGAILSIACFSIYIINKQVYYRTMGGTYFVLEYNHHH